MPYFAAFGRITKFESAFLNFEHVQLDRPYLRQEKLLRPLTIQTAVAVVSLNSPDKANTQNLQILYDLNNAFDKACQDNEVKVVLLRAEGKHFIFFRLLRSLTSGRRPRFSKQERSNWGNMAYRQHSCKLRSR